MAAGDAFRCLRNAAYRITFPMRNTADALVSGETVTANISVNSGSFATPAGAVTEIDTSGIYYVDLTVAELTTTSNATFYATSANATPFYANLPFESAADSGVAQAAAASTVRLRTSASATDDYYNGMVIEIVRGTGAGQTRTVVDYVGSTKDATVDRDWLTNPDTTSVYKLTGVGIKHGTDIVAEANAVQLNDNATAASLLASFSEGMAVMSSVNDVSATTTSWTTATGLDVTDDHYNAAICLFTSGENIGLARQVIDWDGDTDLITTNAFPVAPANGDTFALFGKVF